MMAARNSNTATSCNEGCCSGSKDLSKRLLKMIAAVEMYNRLKTNIKIQAALERRRK